MLYNVPGRGKSKIAASSQTQSNKYVDRCVRTYSYPPASPRVDCSRFGNVPTIVGVVHSEVNDHSNEYNYNTFIHTCTYTSHHEFSPSNPLPEFHFPNKTCSIYASIRVPCLCHFTTNHAAEPVLRRASRSQFTCRCNC